MNARETVAGLLHQLIAEARARNPERPALIGISGAQGSGKSFQCRAFAAASSARAAHFSLDDVYLTAEERESLAHYVNPHLFTRGPPGTHDLKLANGVIARLETAAETRLPRFDKAKGDRAPEAGWPAFQGPAEAILIDGWCIGALPTLASPPLNDLEAGYRGAEWNTEVQDMLSWMYQPFFNAFDAIIYLQAPNWEIVRRWRGEQEEQMLGRAMHADENAALDRFIQHYERVTRAMLAGHHRAHWIAHLDEGRNVTRIERRPTPSVSATS